MFSAFEVETTTRKLHVIENYDDVETAVEMALAFWLEGEPRVIVISEENGTVHATITPMPLNGAVVVFSTGKVFTYLNIRYEGDETLSSIIDPSGTRTTGVKLSRTH